MQADTKDGLRKLGCISWGPKLYLYNYKPNKYYFTAIPRKGKI
ncbi:hypothetical protein J2Y45_004360 [Dyadobacter sp. BE34]|uniref:Uncharacterized protein n=1 Tax=Dyadobacter fermentans TaxID=94254 RepID=A0ABU1R1M0_9BACT|nr:hypothetical protein [Dyadobacter fermentans]MDR7045047.1 hypothetical protein [Dyadobacter sp. BE242]MDR7199217.1 hypothetical protein [Dyadobacter sp. BE34]MDR7217177.1 hypothetical protein [Dyadobacter sp. BE31]MDR7265110.1 hypothetical protein [Dyadobacter sp. BE32]